MMVLANVIVILPYYFIMNILHVFDNTVYMYITYYVLSISALRPCQPLLMVIKSSGRQFLL